MQFEHFNMSALYYQLVAALLSDGRKVGNTKELNNVTFTLTDTSDSLSNCRKMSYSYLIGELIWYIRARNDVDFISYFGPYWEQISDDGLTNNSAYGYVIHKKHGFDQYEQVKKQLQADPNSRRALININVPNVNSIETKDEPCTIALDFMIRDRKLNCTAIMRSSDIWLGIPYDVAYFTTLQRLLAYDLGVGLGTYTHFTASLHLYDKNYEEAEQMRKDFFEEYIAKGELTGPTLEPYWLRHYSQELEDLIMKTRDMKGFKRALVREAYRLNILNEGVPHNERVNYPIWSAAYSQKSTL